MRRAGTLEALIMLAAGASLAACGSNEAAQAPGEAGEGEIQALADAEAMLATRDDEEESAETGEASETP